MLDSFPARTDSGPDDPETWEKALAAALCQYPREVAEDCADPHVGVVTECLSRGGLTAGRIHEWCKRNSAALYEVIARDDARIAADVAARKKREEAESAARAIEGPRPNLEQLKAKYGPTFGLTPGYDPVPPRGVATGADAEAFKARRDARLKEANERAMLAEYAAKGFDPVRNGAGDVLAYGLVASVNPGRLKRLGQEGGDDGGEEI